MTNDIFKAVVVSVASTLLVTLVTANIVPRIANLASTDVIVTKKISNLQPFRQVISANINARINYEKERSSKSSTSEKSTKNAGSQQLDSPQTDSDSFVSGYSIGNRTASADLTIQYLETLQKLEEKYLYGEVVLQQYAISNTSTSEKHDINLIIKNNIYTHIHSNQLSILEDIAGIEQERDIKISIKPQ